MIFFFGSRFELCDFSKVNKNFYFFVISLVFVDWQNKDMSENNKVSEQFNFRLLALSFCSSILMGDYILRKLREKKKAKIKFFGSENFRLTTVKTRLFAQWLEVLK